MHRMEKDRMEELDRIIIQRIKLHCTASGAEQLVRLEITVSTISHSIIKRVMVNELIKSLSKPRSNML